MNKFLILAATVLLAACASAAPVIVNAANTPPAQTEPTTAASSFPITCMRPGTFALVTGPRTRVMQFSDRVDSMDVVVHVDTFQDGDEHVIVLYHTFPANPNLVCVLHASPDENSVHFYNQRNDPGPALNFIAI